MQQRIIDQLILTAGAWQDSGGKDEFLNRQFGSLLNELSRVANVSVEEATDLLLAELGEVGVAA